MDLRDAKAQIEREHPELAGSAKVAAIKRLRDADRPAKSASAGGPAVCGSCEQPSQVKVERGWPAALGFVALCELVALAVAVAGLWRSVDVGAIGPVGRLVLWPAAITPGWLAVLAAAAALLVAAAAAGAAGERARSRAVCARCGAPVSGR
jgi:hypothetical protein